MAGDFRIEVVDSIGAVHSFRPEGDSPVYYDVLDSGCLAISRDGVPITAFSANAWLTVRLRD